MTQKIDKLESNLEDRLCRKLDTLLETTVSGKLKDIETNLIRKLNGNMEVWERGKQVLTAETQTFKGENRIITNTLMHHQRYLESMESAKRAMNLIITGLSEEAITVEDRTVETDEEKVKVILSEKYPRVLKIKTER